MDEDPVSDINESDQNEGVISDGQDSSSEDETVAPAKSYANLLQALKSNFSNTSERPTKRRKLENGRTATEVPEKKQEVVLSDNAQDDVDAAQLTEDIDEDGAADDSSDSDDEDVLLQDPFEKHYTNVEEEDLKSAAENNSKKPNLEKSVVGEGIRKVITSRSVQSSIRRPTKKSSLSANVKKRLREQGSTLLNSLEDEALDVAAETFEYQDVLLGIRSFQNSAKYRDIAALHALNHIFKTRDRVLKNNAKLAQESTEDLECRDQGFTRPKVLVLLPTKQSCVRFIDSLTRISEPDQQENRHRFMETFSRSDDDSFQNKPDDFRELFTGNHEEDFRVGLKFTRKTIKYFSGFYNSDIILASPLGLMRTVTTGGGKKESKKSYDADFLSSIEIVVVDHANALEMQNWQHVDYVFSQLNQIPKESHGCDFARVRNWYLDGKAKFLRQTIVFSDYLTPSIASLASNHLHNIAGRVKYTPTYPGTMINLPPTIPFTLTQSFLRFDSPTPQADSDVRFKFFISTILPNILRSATKASSKGTLVFVPTYLDFVRLRNHFSTAAETTSLSFGTVSEYSSKGEVARARSHFMSGRNSVLLYSERAHHYFRYKLKGIRRLIFYGVPDNPTFWTEMIDSLGMNAAHDLEWAQSQRGKQGKGLVRALFSKWDVMKLERIVGTDRVGRLVSEKEGDVFDFV